MTYNVDLFIKELLSDQPVKMSLYAKPDFCIAMRLHALEKIKFLLLNILSSHLPHEHVGSKDPFFLSADIRKVDQNGLNILDYCALGGLDEVGGIFAKLGCENTINTERLTKKFSDYYSATAQPEFVQSMNKTLEAINSSKGEYKNSPLGGKRHAGGEPNASTWQKIKHLFKTFDYRHHKFALLILLFGISCLIAAPFTSGLSTILLLTLGFPSMLSALSNLQNAVISLKNYQQVEENGRVLHEAEMLKTMHKEISHQLKTVSEHKEHVDVSMKVTHKIKHLGSKKPSMLYAESNKHDKEIHKVFNKAIAKNKVRLEPPSFT